MIEFSKGLKVTTTSIPGLLLVDLPVHGDSRGWFKENWQREKMLALGLPDLGPVQNNISFNDAVGTTRGIHAEPWDKYVSVATGKIFGAWVDLREGKTFGTVFTTEIDPSQAIYVPRGVANSYQTLEPETAYVYLVNDHWSPSGTYTFVNLADETLGIQWPIPLEQVEISEKDQSHPRLSDVTPMKAKKTLVLGANGQLGKALSKVYLDAHYVGRDECDLTHTDALSSFDWSEYSTVINATAFTAVDEAETPQGRKKSWATNVTGLGRLVEVCQEHKLTLVHVSSDYVFDGTKTKSYTEEDELCPLGVYGQTKAAGDALVKSLPKHYILRTSWVIGEGNNFVRKMASLASKSVSPNVVNDQVGRLTFTEDLAMAIAHLLNTEAPYGTYNCTNTGEPGSWADIAQEVFAAVGTDANAVKGVSTAEYYEGKDNIAPRPHMSVLDTTKIEATGFTAPDWTKRLASYLQEFQ
jgi:dTDP-4-dehydrorhamnose 3,5-epimerase